MSNDVDAKSGEEAYDELTSDDIRKFWEAVGASQRCPVCSFERWEVINSASQGYAPVLLGLRNHHELKTYGIYPMIQLNCVRCGYTRLHSRHKIVEWVRTGKLDSETSDE